MTYNYTFQTPERGYDFVPVAKDLVRVQSEDKESLEELLNTLELAGIAERGDKETREQVMEHFQELEIEEGSNDYDTFYFVEMPKADLALYLQFEILNYMGAASV
jgi:hypothetical protein